MGARRRALLAGAIGTAAAGATGARWLRSPARRDRIARSARVWRLTVRRGTAFALMKARGAAADEQRRRALEEQFKIRSAEDVARELGHMKGVIMKAGQMLSFIIDGLPEPARQSLASLQGDVTPMSPA